MIVIFSYENASNERVANREALATQLPDAEIYIGGENTCQNFVNILKACKGDELLLIEDDVRLCNHFSEELDEALFEYGNDVINFHYNFPFSTETKEYPVSKYAYNQCVYIPSRVVSRLIAPCEAFIKRYPYFVQKKDYSTQIKFGLIKSGEISFVAHEPKLVKHLGFASAIGNHPVVTRNFIDDL